MPKSVQKGPKIIQKFSKKCSKSVQKLSKIVQRCSKRSKKYAYVIYEWPKRNDVDPRHSANAWIISKKIEIKFLDFINVHSLQTPKTMQ